MLHGLVFPTFRQAPRAQHAGRFHRRAAQAASFPFQPALEVPTPGDVKSGQQFAAVLRQSLTQLVPGKQQLESTHVGGHPGADADERLAVSPDGSRTQLRDEEVERLRQGLPCTPLGQVRPEERQQFVSLAGSVRVSEGQVDEQAESLGLRDYRPGIPLLHTYVAPAQQEQFDRCLVPRFVHVQTPK